MFAKVYRMCRSTQYKHMNYIHKGISVSICGHTDNHTLCYELHVLFNNALFREFQLRAAISHKISQNFQKAFIECTSYKTKNRKSLDIEQNIAYLTGFSELSIWSL